MRIAFNGHALSASAPNTDSIFSNEEDVNPNEHRLKKSVFLELALVCGCETKRDEIHGDASPERLNVQQRKGQPRALETQNHEP